MNTRTFEIFNGTIQNKVSNKAKISLERILARGANLQRGKQQQRYSVLGQVQGEGKRALNVAALFLAIVLVLKLCFITFR